MVGKVALALVATLLAYLPASSDAYKFQFPGTNLEWSYGTHARAYNATRGAYVWSEVPGAPKGLPEDSPREALKALLARSYLGGRFADEAPRDPHTPRPQPVRNDRPPVGGGSSSGAVNGTGAAGKRGATSVRMSEEELRALGLAPETLARLLSANSTSDAPTGEQPSSGAAGEGEGGRRGLLHPDRPKLDYSVVNQIMSHSVMLLPPQDVSYLEGLKQLPDGPMKDMALAPGSQWMNTMAEMNGDGTQTNNTVCSDISIGYFDSWVEEVDDDVSILHSELYNMSMTCSSDFRIQNFGYAYTGYYLFSIHNIDMQLEVLYYHTNGGRAMRAPTDMRVSKCDVTADLKDFDMTMDPSSTQASQASQFAELMGSMGMFGGMQAGAMGGMDLGGIDLTYNELLEETMSAAMGASSLQMFLDTACAKPGPLSFLPSTSAAYVLSNWSSIINTYLPEGEWGADTPFEGKWTDPDPLRAETRFRTQKKYRYKSRNIAPLLDPVTATFMERASVTFNEYHLEGGERVLGINHLMNLLTNATGEMEVAVNASFPEPEEWSPLHFDVTLDKMVTRGLNTFREFKTEMIGDHTIETSFDIEEMELETHATMHLTPNNVDYLYKSEDERRFVYDYVHHAEQFVTTTKVRDLRVKTAMFIAPDRDQLDLLTLGRLEKNLTFCLASIMLGAEVTEQVMTVGEISAPTFSGFKSSGLQALFAQNFISAEVLLEGVVERAFSKAQGTTNLRILNNAIRDRMVANYCPSYKKPKEAEYIDMAKVALDVAGASAFTAITANAGGDANSQAMQNDMSMSSSEMQDMMPSDVATLNELMSFMGRLQSGTDGQLVLPHSVIYANTEEAALEPQQIGSSFYQLMIKEMRISGMDTIAQMDMNLETGPYTMRTAVRAGYGAPMVMEVDMMARFMGAADAINNFTLSFAMSEVDTVTELMAKVDKGALYSLPLAKVVNASQECLMGTIADGHLKHFHMHFGAVDVQVFCEYCESPALRALDEMQGQDRSRAINQTTHFLNRLMTRLSRGFAHPKANEAFNRIFSGYAAKCEGLRPWWEEREQQAPAADLQSEMIPMGIFYALVAVIIINAAIFGRTTYMANRKTRLQVLGTGSKYDGTRWAGTAYIDEYVVDEQDDYDDEDLVKGGKHSLHNNPNLPPNGRVIVPTLLGFSALLFAWAHMEDTAVINIHVKQFGTSMMINEVVRINTIDTVVDLVKAKSYFTANIILVVSVIWPYAKVLMLAFTWFAPRRLLFPETRSILLFSVDRFSKWSFADIFMTFVLGVVLFIRVWSAEDVELVPDGLYGLEVFFNQSRGMAVFVTANVLCLIASTYQIRHDKLARDATHVLGPLEAALVTHPLAHPGLVNKAALSPEDLAARKRAKLRDRQVELMERVLLLKAGMDYQEDEEEHDERIKAELEEEQKQFNDNETRIMAYRFGLHDQSLGGDTLQVTLAGKIAMVALLVVAGNSLGLGMVLPTLNVKVTGVLGYVMSSAEGDFEKRPFPIFLVPWMSSLAGAAAGDPLTFIQGWYLAMFLFSFLLLIPGLDLFFLFLLWCFPVNLKDAKILLLVSDTLASWSALEVMVVASMLVQFTVTTLSNAVDVCGFEGLDLLIQGILVPLELIPKDNSHCFKIEVESAEGMNALVLGLVSWWAASVLIRSFARSVVNEQDLFLRSSDRVLPEPFHKGSKILVSPVVTVFRGLGLMKISFEGTEKWNDAMAAKKQEELEEIQEVERELVEDYKDKGITLEHDFLEVFSHLPPTEKGQLAKPKTLDVPAADRTYVVRDVDLVNKNPKVRNLEHLLAKDGGKKEEEGTEEEEEVEEVEEVEEEEVVVIVDEDEDEDEEAEDDDGAVYAYEEVVIDENDEDVEYVIEEEEEEEEEESDSEHVK